MQATLDAGLPKGAVRLVNLLAFAFMNRERRAAWPSMALLCRTLTASERALRRDIEALVARGHLVVESGGGRARSNVYRWSLKPGNPGEIAGGTL